MNRRNEISKLITQHRSTLFQDWIEAISESFPESKELGEAELVDHLMVVLDLVCAGLDESYESDLINTDDVETLQKPPEDQKGSSIHGRQRASITAYNADRVYWEYVTLRRLLVSLLQEHNLLDVHTLEDITRVVEICSQNSLKSFTTSVQSVQRKIMGSIVHDIRNPLNVISTLVDLQSIDESYSVTNADTKPRFDRAMLRISEMLEDMLQTISFDGGQGLDLKFKRENLLRHLDILGKDFEALYPGRVKILANPDLESFVFDIAAITRLIENLISNAVKYSRPESDVTLQISTDEKYVSIAIHNLGDPINKADQILIFEFLNRTSGQQNNQGKSWGIGLALAKAVVRGHQGTLNLSSDELNGTTFKIDIPRHGLQVDSVVTVLI